MELNAQERSSTWREVTVDDLKATAEKALSTGPFGSSIGSRFFTFTGIPVIRGGNLAADGRTHLVDRGLVFLSPKKAAEFERSAVFPGDLIFTCWGTINQVGLISNRAAYPKYIISNKQMKFTPNAAKADSLFLFYLFSSADLQSQIANQSIGSSVPGFNLGQLRTLRFRVPELSQQKAIADVLSDADALIESLEQLIAKKRDIKQGAMQELLTGRRRLSGYTGKWQNCAIGEGVTLLSGCHVLAAHCNSQSIGVPYLTGPADFPNGIIHQTKFTDRPTTLCRKGDILITVKGSGSGTLVLADNTYCISRQLMAVRVHHEWNSQFIFYLLLQNAAKIHSASTGLIPGVSRANILEQTMPMPRISEQNAIADVLGELEIEVSALESKLTKARQIKQGMMQELLTGRIRLV